MVAPTLVANARTKLVTSNVIRKLSLRTRIRTTYHLLALPYVPLPDRQLSPTSKGVHSFPSRMTNWGPNVHIHVGDTLHLNCI